MTDNEKQLRTGDKVFFDIVRSGETITGRGVVTRINGLGPVIEPDLPMAQGTIMLNIRKVG